MLLKDKYFFKYVSADTTLKVFQNISFKYSSPILFNDPFDTQTKLCFDFESNYGVQV